MVQISVAESMPDFAGQSLDNGRLQLLDSLGAGAYGKVYRALDVTSPADYQVYYAVKCLYKPESGSRQEEYQTRELALHQLVCDHTNIVTLHKVLYDDRYVYMVLDLCAGGDLFTAITESQIFHNNVQLIKDAFVQLIDAIQHCHQKNVFHRDLKPENVLCSKDGSDIRLADFGLSTQSPFSKDFGCGSSYYMSPECIGKELCIGRYSTPTSDIWSLGVILTNMLCARNPWRSATLKDDCFAAYLRDRNFLRQVLPISAGANAILKRIFHINPMRRISLLDLRREILELDTFFMSEEELATANACVLSIVNAHPGSKHQDTRRLAAEDTLFEGDSSGTESSNSSASSGIVCTLNGPPPHVPLSLVASTPISVATHSVEVDTFVNGVSLCTGCRESGSSSGEESSEPITPATHAVDPAVEIPDLPEGENINHSATFLSSVTDKTAPRSVFPAKLPVSKRTLLFRKAVQRFKGLSTSSGSS